MKRIKVFSIPGMILILLFCFNQNVLPDPWKWSSLLNKFVNVPSLNIRCETDPDENIYAVQSGESCATDGTFQWYTYTWGMIIDDPGPPVVFHWGWVPTAITGATSNIYTITYNTAHNGNYWCVVDCQDGGGSYSTDTVLYEYATVGPSVTNHPDNATICEGSTAGFSTTATGEYLHFLWYKMPDGGDWDHISGETSATYSFTPSAVDDLNQYKCLIYNGCNTGGIYTNPATLDIRFNPTISQHPSPTTVCEGESHTYSLQATGDGLTYQWQESINDGGGWGNLTTSGKYTINQNQLAISDIEAGMSGYLYRCIVSGLCSPDATTSNAALTVNTAPSIISAPTGGEFCTGENVMLSVTASGTPPLEYYWRKNDVGLDVWNDSINYHIQSIETGDGGSYDVLVRNVCETNGIESDNANVIVKVPPSIDNQANPDPVCQGEPSVQFSVTASGDNISYHWQMSENGGDDWSDLSNNTTYSGTTSSTLNIANPIGDMNAQLYRCRVEGDCSPDATSTEALLTVYVPPSIDTEPQPVTVCLGENFTLAVSVSGTSPLYLWRKDGISLAGWTASPTYIVTGAGQSDAGAYDVLVKNICTDPSSIESDDAIATVNIPPSISSQPEDITLCEGSQPSVSFSTTVAGSGLSYQWEYMIDDNQIWYDLENNTTFSGVTTHELIISSTNDTLNQYTFRCKIIGVCDPPVTTDMALLTINTSPEIIEQPVSKVACEGYDVTLTVTATGTMPLQYRWKKNGVSIGDWTTDASLDLSGVSAGDAGLYNVLVDNLCSDTPVESDNATVTVNIPPTINTHPEDVTICEGSQPSVSFSTTVSGSGLSYLWEYSEDEGQTWTDLENNTTFSGVTTDGLIVASTDNTLDQFAFRCNITGVCDPPVTTDMAVLTIKTSPVITEQPENRVACVGYDVTLTVTATGTMPLQYRWKKDGVSIGDWTTNASLELSGVSAGDAGLYDVLVDNLCSDTPVESDNATVTVNIPPTINTQPEDKTLCEGSQSTVSFSTSVPGSGLSYLWEYSKDEGQNWTDLQNIAPYSGVTTDELTLSSTDDTLDQYIFRCKIIGVCEPPVTTGSARLTIKTAPEFVSHPLAAEICEGDEVTFSAEVNGTEPFQYRWMKGGASLTSWITENSYTIFSATLGDIEKYKVLVKNECNSSGVASEEAQLNVNPSPYISLGSDRHICTGKSTNIDAGTGYTSYNWSTGETTQSISVSDQGNFNVTVSDNKGCMNSDNIYIILDPQLPGINLGEDRRYCSGESVILDAGTGFDVYAWNDGSTGQTLSVYKTDTYHVTASRNNTVCISVDTVDIIIAEPFDQEEICLITVDLQTGRNLIIWEKTSEAGILAYNIYRQTNVLGIYEPIGTIPYDKLSIFKDTIADPEKRQWVYKITAVDTCNNESDVKVSSYHRPLFLQYTGTDDGVNLEWESYVVEGQEMEFLTYEIYRGSDSTTLNKIDEVSADLRVYKDVDNEALNKKNFYRVAGVKALPCYPTGNAKADSGPYSHSMSNLEDNRLQVVEGINLKSAGSLMIQPNPFNDRTTIRFTNPGGESHKMALRNLSGQVVRIIENITSSEFVLEKGNLQNGYYLMEISGREQIFRGKLVVE